MKKLLLFLTIVCFTTSVFSQLDITIQHQICQNSPDASFSFPIADWKSGYSYVEVLENGNLGPVLYLTEGQTSGTLEALNLLPGAYKIMEISFAEDTTYEDVIINPAPPAVQVDFIKHPCFSNNDGAIEVSFIAPYSGSFSWTDAAGTTSLGSTNEISGLSDDSYILNASYLTTNGYECSFDTTFTLTETEEIQVTESYHQNATCPGSNDGSIAVDAVGGTTPYTYLWSNGATTDSIYNLSGGTAMPGDYGEYGLTVTDVNNCKGYFWKMIDQPFAPYITLNTQESSCGNNDGNAKVESIDQLSEDALYNSYSFLWSTGDTTYQVNNLSAGTYSVNITDKNTTCVYTKYITIDDIGITDLNPSITEASCSTCNDGQISLDVAGGQEPYQYLWESGETSNTNTELFPGSYSVTVTDANGCIKTECIGATSMMPLMATVNPTNATCGDSDGSASVYAYGGSGTGTYSYAWNTNPTQTTYTANNLSSGLYECTVTDASGHSIVVSVAVGDNGGSGSLDYTVESSVCGESSINVTYTGGSGSETYLWSTGESTQDISELNEGTYSLLVTDGACKLARNIYVYSEAPRIQPICMVSVGTIDNEEENHNLVIWERSQLENIDHYNIYREGCSGDGTLLGSVGADEITVFEDLTAIPSLRSYSYYITAVDPCGKESEKSPVHKTMHLELNTDVQNSEVQLIWDDYIGFDNPTFSIYRKGNNEQDYNLLATVNNTQYSYTPTAEEDTIYYAIVVTKDVPCNAWNGNNKANGGPYYQSISNLEDDGKIHTSVNNILGEKNVEVYPNPTQDVLNIQSKSDILSIRIYNTSGQQVRHYQNINLNKVHINANMFNKGVYIFDIQTKDRLVKQQIVIQ